MVLNRRLIFVNLFFILLKSSAWAQDDVWDPEPIEGEVEKFVLLLNYSMELGTPPGWYTLKGIRPSQRAVRDYKSCMAFGLEDPSLISCMNQAMSGAAARSRTAFTKYVDLMNEADRREMDSRCGKDLVSSWSERTEATVAEWLRCQRGVLQDLKRGLIRTSIRKPSTSEAAAKTDKALDLLSQTEQAQADLSALHYRCRDVAPRMTAAMSLALRTPFKARMRSYVEDFFTEFPYVDPKVCEEDMATHRDWRTLSLGIAVWKDPKTGATTRAQIKSPEPAPAVESYFNLDGDPGDDSDELNVTAPAAK